MNNVNLLKDETFFTFFRGDLLKQSLMCQVSKHALYRLACVIPINQEL